MLRDRGEEGSFDNWHVRGLEDDTEAVTVYLDGYLYHPMVGPL